MAIKDHFQFVEADEPEIEDDMWEYIADPNWHIQDASFYGNGFSVGYLNKEEESLEVFGEFKTLNEAMHTTAALAAEQCIELSPTIEELEQGINHFCKVHDLPAQSWDEILISDTTLTESAKKILDAASRRHESLPTTSTQQTSTAGPKP